MKVVLSGTGGDELFAGYPWRYYRGLQGRATSDAYFDAYYAFWQRLVPDAGPGRLLQRATTYARVRHHDPRDIFQGVFAPHLPRRRLRGGDRQRLALLRDQDLPARPARRRGQAEHGALAWRRASRSSTTTSSTSPCACPRASSCATSSTRRWSTRTRPARSRATGCSRVATARSSCARPCAGSSRPRSCERRKQGFSAPDASWFKGESIDYVDAAPRSPERAHLRVPRARATSARVLDEHTSRPRQPPPAALVAALLRVVVPAFLG